MDGIHFDGNMMDTTYGDKIAQSVLYNSSAFVEEKENPLTKKLEPTAVGNVTECGLINYLLRSGVNCEEIIAQRKSRILFDVPFDSKRKRATSVVKLDDGTIRVFVKGAPEVVLEFCQNMLI